MRVRELAEWLNTGFEGDGERDIHSAAAIELAGPSDVSFINSRKAAQQAEASAAGCLIVPMDFPALGRTVIRAEAPRTAFAHILPKLHPPRPPMPGIHITAEVAYRAQIG